MCGSTSVRTGAMTGEFSEYGRWPQMIAYPAQVAISITLWIGLIKLFW
jgi:hypothetical protein